MFFSTTQLRSGYCLFFVSTCALLAYALYTQYVDGLTPCALCLTQRGFYFAIGVTGLIAAIHHPTRWGYRIYGALITLAASLGAIVAGRQVWLQSLPEDQVPACGPDLSYIIETFPLMEAVKVLFTGDGNCAEVVWTFLGLSMPSWALIWFIGYAIAALLITTGRIKSV